MSVSIQKSSLPTRKLLTKQGLPTINIGIILELKDLFLSLRPGQKTVLVTNKAVYSVKRHLHVNENCLEIGKTRFFQAKKADKRGQIYTSIYIFATPIHQPEIARIYQKPRNI